MFDNSLAQQIYINGGEAFLLTEGQAKYIAAKLMI